ncbi:MAG: CHRD domain-containing protein [Ignavibacteriales bacterium]
MKRRYTIIILLFLFLSQAVFAQLHFTARLTGSQEVPADSTTATGTAALTLTSEGLHYIITVDSIANITDAHFHLGAIGDTGQVIMPILPIFRGNSAYGIWKTDDAVPLTGDLIQALISGKIYINIHTAAHPKGEIRGQVLLTSGTSFKAALTGNQETPVISSAGSGTGTFILTDLGLAYAITINGLSNITAAHFHLGELGVNGGVVKPITIVGNKAIGLWGKSDATDPLTDKMINALLNDSIYVNVHTSTNPDGEIRGQVHLAGGIGFYANMTGSQEVPVVNTTSKGTGYFVLTNAGLVFAISANSTDSILAAQFFQAPSGMTGGAVRNITELKGKSIAGIWKFNDQEPLTNDLVAELLKGNIYVNLSTKTNPGGEIRGQLIQENRSMFKANLSASQVRTTPPINTKGKGTASFMLTDEGLAFNITLEGTDTIKSAHFHSGKIGLNGNVERSIREFIRYTANGVWNYVDTLQALTPELLDKLFKGEIYVNVRTKVDTLGALRGQVVLTSGTNLRAQLTGSQEVPAVPGNAKGTASFVLTNEGLLYRITVDSIIVSQAHIHRGDIGVAGEVVKDLTADFSNNSATGIWKTTGNQPLTPELIKALLTGKLYVNVHSPGHPNGEIRGQILINGGWGFSAHLNGYQEVPSNNSPARGVSSLILTPAGLAYDMTVTGLQPIAEHFHKAPLAQNGNVVMPIVSDFKLKSVSGVWLTSGPDSLSNDNIASLINEGLYVNAHSAKYPEGEIRGQIVKLVKNAVVSVGKPNTAPRSFNLEQNYPNPFNPSTAIRFSVPNMGQVNLSIFNILGEKVATLINENMAAGSYEVKFDASRLASGIYIYRLNAGNNISTKKMMLLK